MLTLTVVKLFGFILVEQMLFEIHVLLFLCSSVKQHTPRTPRFMGITWFEFLVVVYAQPRF